MTRRVSPQIERNVIERFSAGLGWSLLSAVSMQGSTFVVSILLARLLGRHQFGEFSIIQSTLVTLVLVGQVATGITAAKFVAENRVSNKRVAGEIIGLCNVLTLITGVCGAGLLICFAPWIAADILNTPHLKTGLSIAAAASLFLTMNGFQLGALAGLEAFRSSAIVSCGLGLLHIVLCGLGAWLFGIEGALWGILLSSFVRWACLARLLSLAALAQGIKASWSGWQRQRSVLYTFAIPAAACGMTAMPSLWASTSLLARQPGGFEQLALYSAAYQLRSIALFLPAVSYNVGMSLLNYQKGIGNAEGYRKAFWFNVAIGGAAAATIAIAMGVFGMWLLRMYGRTFTEAYGSLLVLLCSAVFEGVATGAVQAIQSQNRIWSLFWFIVLPRDLLVIVLAYALVGRYGSIGLASSYSVSWIIGSLLTFYYAYRTGLQVQDKRMANKKEYT